MGFAYGLKNRNSGYNIHWDVLIKIWSRYLIKMCKNY